MDVSKLEGAELDLAVMLADGWQKSPVEPSDDYACGATWKLVERVPWVGHSMTRWHCWECQPLAFSTEWDTGGPIIERERIGTSFEEATGLWHAEFEHAARADGVQRTFASGPTPLIAAMRAFVASRAQTE